MTHPHQASRQKPRPATEPEKLRRENERLRQQVEQLRQQLATERQRTSDAEQQIARFRAAAVAEATKLHHILQTTLLRWTGGKATGTMPEEEKQAKSGRATRPPGSAPAASAARESR